MLLDSPVAPLVVTGISYRGYALPGRLKPGPWGRGVSNVHLPLTQYQKAKSALPRPPKGLHYISLQRDLSGSPASLAAYPAKLCSCASFGPWGIIALTLHSIGLSGSANSLSSKLSAATSSAPFPGRSHGTAQGRRKEVPPGARSQSCLWKVACPVSGTGKAPGPTGLPSTPGAVRRPSGQSSSAPRVRHQ